MTLKADQLNSRLDLTLEGMDIIGALIWGLYNRINFIQRAIGTRSDTQGFVLVPEVDDLSTAAIS